MNKEFRPGDYSKEKIFFSSDYHFNHAKIIEFDKRPFKDVSEMHEAIIKNHNEVVPVDGLLYILGDVAMGKDVNSVVKILQRMNGKKVLVKGNHDVIMLKEQSFRDCFEMIVDYYRPTLHGFKIAMFHYPIAEWDQAYRGSWHLHGHIHLGVAPIEPSKFLNVGIMNNKYYPFSFRQIETYMDRQPAKSSHHD